MNWKALGLAAVVTAYAVPAMADEYYVVQDTKTKKCTIVSERPKETTIIQIGPMAFKTRTEAEDTVRTTKVCVTN